MQKWPLTVQSYSVTEVIKFCVKNKTWQTFRLTMKGEPTTKKLDMLHRYVLHNLNDNTRRMIEVQADNYLNALKRGGQLDMDLQVQR